MAISDSTNITVRNLDISHNFEGVMFVNVTDSIIQNVTVCENEVGIALYDSHNCTVKGNNASYNRFVQEDGGRTWGGNGIYLHYGSSNNVVIENAPRDNRESGIWLRHSHENAIRKNNIHDNWFAGICLEFDSFGNVISENVLNNSWAGIVVGESSNCTFYGNNIANNFYGVFLDSYSNNLLYHNNIVSNTQQVHFFNFSGANFWDNGFEGNYWSNYAGTDLNYDGIGDTAHIVDANNTDNYPLIGMFSSFNTSLGKPVNVVSNSTIENFEYFESNSTIKMYVSGEESSGFCRVSIPQVLMNVSNISVIIDDGLTTVLYPNYTLYDNGTHRWIYFAYPHTMHEIAMIPESASAMVLALVVIFSLVTVVLSRKKRHYLEK